MGFDQTGGGLGCCVGNVARAGEQRFKPGMDRPRAGMVLFMQPVMGAGGSRRDGIRKARKAWGGARPAQHALVEEFYVAMQQPLRLPALGKRMFEGCKQRHGRALGGEHLRHQQQEAAGARMRQRLAATVIDGDVPAREISRDPAGEIAVRRHQGGRAAGCFKSAAQGKGDGQALKLRAVRADHGKAVKRCVRHIAQMRACVPPGIGGFRRAQGLADKAGAGSGGCVIIRAGSRPQGHIVSFKAHA